MSSNQRLSCANGCEIAYHRSSVNQCKADCREGNKNGCSYDHPNIATVFRKCGTCQQGCNKWPDEDACEDGCDFASNFPEFYQGGGDNNEPGVIDFCGIQQSPDEVMALLDSSKATLKNMIETLDDQFSRRRRLGDGAAEKEVSKFAKFFKNAAPYLGFVSSMLAYGNFIAGLVNGNDIPSWAQDILDGVEEISEEIVELTSIVNNGFADIQFADLKREISDEQNDINKLRDDFESYSKYPNNSARTENFRSQCNDDGKSPDDIFKTLYRMSCKDCDVYGSPLNINLIEDAGIALDRYRYTRDDKGTFISEIGAPVLAAMIDALFYKTVCLPRTSSDQCFFQDGGWKDDIDKMTRALEEVAEHVDNQASKLEKCYEKKVRLYRVSKLDEGNFGRGDGKKFDFLFQLNGKHYMPRDQSDCDNGLCRKCNLYPSCPGWRVCHYSSRGWRRNTCQVPKISYNDRFYPQSPEEDVDLRYTSAGTPRRNSEEFVFQGIEKDRGNDSKWRKFNVATFDLDDEIENGRDSCEEYKLTQTNQINGVNGCVVELLVMPKQRDGR